MKLKIKPHKRAPKRLIKVWLANQCNYYKTGQQLGVNESWVWQLIIKGKEPARLDLRQKLFLTRKKTKEQLEVMRLRKVYDKQQVDKEVFEYFKKVIGG